MRLRFLHRASERATAAKPGACRWLTAFVARGYRRRVGGLAILLGLGWLCGLSAGDPGGRHEVLTIGLTKTAFLNVNRNDMEAALKVLAQTIAHKHGYQVEVQTHFYEEPASFAAAVKTGAARLAITDSWTYLAMELGSHATPCFVSTVKDTPAKRYLLITRRDSGLKALADLRGKSLAVHEVVNSSLGRPWLQTLMSSNHLGNAEEFFSRFEAQGKPTVALLPVYFGKTDACLMDEGAFQVMIELNPQVGERLQPIATSDPLVDGLQVLSRKGWEGAEQFRQDVIDAMGDLHREPAGAQLLTLFKTDRLTPFQPTHLETVKSMRAVYDKLGQVHAPTSPPPSDPGPAQATGGSRSP